MAKRILIVEDDPSIGELLTYNLQKEGYDVIALVEGSQVVGYVLSRMPDLIVLDVMLPGLDGIEVCRLLKANDKISQIPIVMLTAKGEESDVIVGLQMGADDYISKPFSVKVFMARIKSVLRRTATQQPGHKSAAQEVRQFDELTLDLVKHKVMVSGAVVELTAIEFDILAFLSRSPGRVYTREQILNGVWKEGKFIIDRAVDVHIRGLRKKLASADTFIETVRGVGYRFRDME